MKEGQWWLRVANPTESVTHIEVAVNYDKGGANPFTGGSDPRGIYLYVRPLGVEYREDGSIRCTKFGLFKGYRRLLELCNRASPRKLRSHREIVGKCIASRHLLSVVWSLVEKVLAEEKLELAPLTQEEALRLEAKVSDDAKLVFADWLEEHGRFNEASIWRMKAGAPSRTSKRAGAG